MTQLRRPALKFSASLRGDQMPGQAPVKPLVVFLFGSGISQRAHLPLAGDITPVVLSGAGVFRHTDGRYLFGSPPRPEVDRTDDFLRRILLFLQLIKVEADVYYFLDREVNYEDLYFIVNQVFGCLSWDEDNPVPKRFTDYLGERLNHLLTSDCCAKARDERNVPPSRPIRFTDRLASLRQLAGESCSYIRDVACGKIGVRPADLDYLGWLVEAVEDKHSDQKLFFTLNYDTLLEEFFRRANVRLVDGFGSPVEMEGVSYFDARLFADREHPHVFKLHGSLDWFLNRRVSPAEEEPLRLLRPTVPELAAKNFDFAVAPFVLVGTHNKPGYYTKPLFEEQHWRFKEALSEADRLVICGYSFGDEAINTRLLYWLDQFREGQVLLIHHDPEACRKRARPQFAGMWENHVKRGQWNVIRKKMEEVSWSEVKAAMGF